MKSKFLEKSICADCEHLSKRIIEIQDLTEFLDELGISLDEEDYAEDDADVIIESFICKYLCIELDHYVIECDSYSKKMDKKIIKNKKILTDIT
jgi:hypothetical protein